MSEQEIRDHAKDILAKAADLSDDQRADAWDAWHESKDPQELSERLKDVPADIAGALLAAKERTMPEPPAAARAVEAMAKINPEHLDLAEKHPTVLQTLIDAIRGKR